MADLLSSGASWLAGKLKNFAGRSVTYRRGSTSYSGLTATHQSQLYDVIQEDGIATSVRLDDFIWTYADLPVKPRQGDLIIETINGVEQSFEVRPIGDLPCWELMESSESLAIVHTKRVE